jgi:hypothetical protein
MNMPVRALQVDAVKTNLASPQRAYLFELEIPSPKGLGSADLWNLRCLELEDPERAFETIHIDVKGSEGFDIPGRATVSHSFNVTVEESEDAQTFNAINSWMDLIRDAESGEGVSDLEIKSDALVIYYSTDGSTITRKQKVIGIWPKKRPMVKLQSGSSNRVQFAVEFSFDRIAPSA